MRRGPLYLPGPLPLAAGDTRRRDPALPPLFPFPNRAKDLGVEETKPQGVICIAQDSFE